MNLLGQIWDLRSLMLNSYIATTTYVAPPQGHLDQAEVLFQKLLTTRNFSQEDANAWSQLELRLTETRDDFGRRYAVIAEFDPPGNGTGQGFFAIKLDPVTPSEQSKFLQGPHRPSDLHTHEIVLDLLRLSDVFGGAGWATTHRNNVDLCKEPRSYYNSFTTAIAKASSTPTILQVHGFAKEGQSMDVDVVFSSTKQNMTQEIEAIADCVKEGLSPWIVAKFPEEADFLGGTLNINANLFYGDNSAGKFIHFETSRELREELRVDSTLKLQICECFNQAK